MVCRLIIDVQQGKGYLGERWYISKPKTLFFLDNQQRILNCRLWEPKTIVSGTFWELKIVSEVRDLCNSLFMLKN